MLRKFLFCIITATIIVLIIYLSLTNKFISQRRYQADRCDNDNKRVPAVEKFLTRDDDNKRVPAVEKFLTLKFRDVCETNFTAVSYPNICPLMDFDGWLNKK